MLIWHKFVLYVVLLFLFLFWGGGWGFGLSKLGYMLLCEITFFFFFFSLPINNQDYDCRKIFFMFFSDLFLSSSFVFNMEISLGASRWFCACSTYQKSEEILWFFLWLYFLVPMLPFPFSMLKQSEKNRIKF